MNGKMTNQLQKREKKKKKLRKYDMKIDLMEFVDFGVVSGVFSLSMCFVCGCLLCLILQ